MTRQDIYQLNDTRPYCFYTDREEKWYEIGLIDGVDVADSEPKVADIWKEMRLEVLAQASLNRREPNISDERTKMFSLYEIDEIIEKITEQYKEK